MGAQQQRGGGGVRVVLLLLAALAAAHAYPMLFIEAGYANSCTAQPTKPYGAHAAPMQDRCVGGCVCAARGRSAAVCGCKVTTQQRCGLAAWVLLAIVCWRRTAQRGLQRCHSRGQLPSAARSSMAVPAPHGCAVRARARWTPSAAHQGSQASVPGAAAPAPAATLGCALVTPCTAARPPAGLPPLRSSRLAAAYPPPRCAGVWSMSWSWPGAAQPGALC